MKRSIWNTLLELWAANWQVSRVWRTRQSILLKEWVVTMWSHEIVQTGIGKTWRSKFWSPLTIKKYKCGGRKSLSRKKDYLGMNWQETLWTKSLTRFTNSFKGVTQREKKTLPLVCKILKKCKPISVMNSLLNWWGNWISKSMDHRSKVKRQKRCSQPLW